MKMKWVKKYGKFMDAQTASLQSKSCRNTFESSLCIYMYICIYSFFVSLFIYFFV